MEIVLRPYQQTFHNDIVSKISGGSKRILAVLATGGGKSIVISTVASALPGRSLVLTPRIELFKQNKKWLGDTDIMMSQTVTRRALSLSKYDNIIIDEIHLNYFDTTNLTQNIIGFTATPLAEKLEKRFDKHGREQQRYPGVLTGATMVEGISTSQLISLGYLSRPKYKQLTPDNLDDIGTGGATFKQLKELLVNTGKTIIFNANTKINKSLLVSLRKTHSNVRAYDTVNQGHGQGSRKEIVQWFKDTPDAILLNVSIFTTGFDVPDIDTVILNRAIQSLPLALQCIGRGSRTAPNKTHFNVLDLGLNIHRHGLWETARIWKEETEWKNTRKSDILSIWECIECGAYNPSAFIECSECGAEKKLPDYHLRKINGKMVEVENLSIPSVNGFIDYVKSVGGDRTTAFRLARRRMIDFILSRAKDPTAITKVPRASRKRVAEIYRPFYFAILFSDLKSTVQVKLETELKRIYNL